MNQVIKNLKRSILILLFAWLVGFMGLLLVYCIPTHMIKTKNAITTFSIEGPGPILYEGYISSRLDNYTDSLMINTAQYDSSESVVNKALLNYHYEIEGKTPFEAFVLGAEKGNEVKAVSYARYWHGYLVILKPLLCIFDYVTLRNINGWVQFGLMLWIIFKMMSGKLKGYILPFLGMLVVLNPIAVSKSLQYSSIFYISFFSILYILYRGSILIESGRIWLFMVIIGCVTSYFDFLTYPVVTLCVSLIFLEVHERKDVNTTFQYIMDRCMTIIYWGIGYIGMWAGKWFLASLVTRENIIKDAILSALYRMSNGTADSGTYEKINSIMSLKQNVTVFQPRIYWILAIIISLIIVVVSKMSGKQCISLECIKQKIIYLGIIGCIPFLWVMLICNHSYVHYWMTFRNFSVSVMAWGVMLKMIVEYFSLQRN